MHSNFPVILAKALVSLCRTSASEKLNCREKTRTNSWTIIGKAMVRHHMVLNGKNNKA